MNEVRKLSVSQARQLLIELLHDIRFGRIENLDVVGHEPVLAPAPRIVKSVVLDRDGDLGAKTVSPDFVLKDQFVRLFRLFDMYESFRILSLEVKHGLPCHMEILELPRAA